VVSVVTDSAANVPPDLARELGITVVPLRVRFGDETLRDGVDIGGTAFYERLRAGEIASTSAPSVGDWLAGLQSPGAGEVVCVTLASGLSATHQEAVLAAEQFEGRVVVVDSGNASMAEGFAAIEAARAADAGAGIDDVATRAEEIAVKVGLMGAIESFEHLRRSGRVTRLQAYAATALSIRPIFRLAAGEIEPVGRARTRSRALAMLVQEAVKAAGGGRLHVAALHADSEDDARTLLERVRAECDVAEEYLVEATPVIGANAGPGLVGLAFYAEPVGPPPG
jgi:DegV family protein with EDD domain